MSWGPCAVLCCLIAGCAADHRVDPSDLELRDVLGLAPEVALSWNADERAAARRVLEAGMHGGAALDAPVGRDPTLDRSLANALAAADAARVVQRQAALGVVELAVGHDHLHASAHASTLAPHRTAATELQLAGWTRRGWSELPARGLDVLTAIASDAGHRGGPLLVTPAPQLAVIAAYVPASAASRARLVVNPVLLAALEPGQVHAPAVAAILPDDPIGNPYTFYTSVAACAAAQAQRCGACLAKGTCTPLEGTGDGNAECTQLAANDGRGYALACINFALAIDTVATCAASAGPACPMETRAATSITLLEANADFLDQASCAGALDQCLGEIFGDASPSSSTTPPPSPGDSVSCSDTACEASPDCSDSGCGDDTGDSSCDSSSDSSDSSCDSGDGGGCSGDSGGDCSSSDSGGDCSGGDSGCSGDSGGDCSGGGGDDCSASHRRGPDDRSLLWAALPLPFAIFARRRAGRRRARREVAP